jgi:hypothetical protein
MRMADEKEQAWTMGGLARRKNTILFFITRKMR